MARQKSKASYRRGLIDNAINNAQARIEQERKAAQEAAKAQIPDYAKGMSLDDVNRIIDSYNSQNAIPKLEQNTTPTTPSISDELERMKKAKADTTTPRTEGEQKAIDTYYDSLMKASGQTPSTSAPTNTPSVDYKAEIDRMNALKADTTTPRTEGENKAIETYLNSLVDAQRYLDSHKPITKPSVKTSSSEKKVTQKNVKNIGTVEIKADGTKNYTKTMSPNEQRDYERALLAQSKARGRALSPNEQRDLERAQNAIAQAKEREKVTEESVNKVMPTSARENTEELQFGQLRQKPKATPTPGDFKETTQEILESKTEEKPESNIIPELGKNYALRNPGVKPRTTMETIRDLAVNVTDKGAATPESVLWNYNIPSEQWKEIDKDFANYNTWRGSQSDLANQGNFIASLASSNISKKLQDKYGLDEQTLNQLANDYKNTKSTYEGVQKERTAQNIGANHPIGGSIISLGSGALGSVLTPTQLADDLTNYVYNGQQTSPYEGAHLLNQTKEAYREGVKENIDSNALKTAYDVGMGVGDMGIAMIPSLISPVSASTSAALGLASQTANRASTGALERGANPIQSTAFGTAAGALDFLTNKVGLDKAKDLAMEKITSTGVKKFLMQNGIAGSVEAAENLIQDFGEMAFDEAINGNKSENRTSYANHIANGESPEEALKNVVKEIFDRELVSGLTGFAMGSAMQGGTSLVNNAYARIILNDIENNSQKVQDMVNEHKANKLNALKMAEENADITNEVETQRQALNNIENLENQIPEKPTNFVEQTPLSERLINPEDNRITNDVVNPIEEPTPITDNNVNNSEGITSGNKKQSRVITNSAINGDIITPEEYANNPELQRIAEYEEHSNIRTYKQAQRDVANNGAQLAQDYINGNKAIKTDLDVDRSMIIMQQLAKDIDASENPTGLIAQRDAILRNAVENGVEGGQFIQAFAKYANTPEEALLKATKLDMESTKKWKSRNKKTRLTNSRIAKALEQMGHKPEPSKERTPLSHDQLKERVKAELDREMGSVSDKFTDDDLEYLTVLAENKDIPVWQITSEIEHKLQTGEWYTLDESIEPPKPGSRKLQNALNRLMTEESTQSVPERKSFEQIREEVKNTIEKEYGSVNDFDDSDINYISNLIEQGATSKEITDSLNTRLATGRWGISTETQNAVNDIFDTIRHFDENSREFVEGQAEAFRLLAEEVAPDATAFEKFDAWRYIAMLGNPKTMLRNYVGNKLFSAVVGTSNNLAALIESKVDRKFKKKGAKEAKRAERINNRIARLEESNSTRAQKEIPRLTEKAQRLEERSQTHSQGIERTKAILNPFSDKDLIDASYLDGFGKRYRQFEGSKYEKATKDAIKQQRSVFDSKAMQLVEKAVDRGISDTKAVARKYSTSLAGYLKANGYDASVFDLQNEYDSIKQASRNRDLTPEEVARMKELKPTMDFLEKARDYALDQAEYATFHEDNAFADWLSEASRKAPGIGKYVIEGAIPFKKTPANILRSGYEYSPFGALKSIRKTGKLIYENTGSRKGNLDDTYINKKGKEVSRTLANDVIDSWSKTLTGSGLAGLGYFLFNKGILTSSTKDEKYQDQLEGIGNYAININGHTYTLDWAAPGVMPLLIGAEVNKVLKSNAISDKEWYANPDMWLGTVNALLDPLFETSMLSGIKDTLQTAANEVRYNEDNAIGGILGSLVGNAATSYATQAIPTLFGQVARTIDPIRRTTDTYNEGILGTIEKQGRKAANKIPFLSQINTPYVDAKGQRQYNSPFRGEGLLPTLGNLTYQMLSPGYYSHATTNDADRMARNVYNETRDPKVFSDWKSTKKVNGEKLNPAQMWTYREQMGKANGAVRDLLAHNQDFLNMPYDVQKDILKNVNTFADKYGESTVNPKFETTDTLYKAYYEGGTFQSVVDEIIAKQYMKDAGVKSNSNAGKEIKESVKSGDTAKTQELVDTNKTIKSLADYGLKGTKVESTYANALSYDNSLTPEAFANTWNKIDSDNSGGISIDELEKYANSVGDQYAEQVFEMYYGGWHNKSGQKRKLHKVDGTWVSYYP